MERSADHLVDMHIIEKRHALAADLARVPERPQSIGLGRVDQSRHDQVTLRARTLVHVVLDRIDPVLHEVLDPAAQ